MQSRGDTLTEGSKEVFDSDFRVYGSSGCLGVCGKGEPATTSLGKPSGRFGQRDRKIGWSSSSDEMENRMANSRSSQRRASSINATSTSYSQENNNPTNSQAEGSTFVNHSLHLWNERRRVWVGDHHQQERSLESRRPVISRNSTHEDLLTSTRPFPQPIPLPEMVSFLVDLWLQEGLYD